MQKRSVNKKVKQCNRGHHIKIWTKLDRGLKFTSNFISFLSPYHTLSPSLHIFTSPLCQTIQNVILKKSQMGRWSPYQLHPAKPLPATYIWWLPRSTRGRTWWSSSLTRTGIILLQNNPSGAAWEGGWWHKTMENNTFSVLGIIYHRKYNTNKYLTHTDING